MSLTIAPTSYPVESLAAAEEGTLTVELGIGPDGGVTDVVLQQSSGHARLDQAGLVVARRTKLSAPPMRDGVPTAARVLADLIWKLPLTPAEKYFALTDPLTRAVYEEIRHINSGKEPLEVRPPRPAAGGNRINPNNYPSLSITRNEQGRAIFVAHIGADGSVVDAHLVSSSGFDRLDQWALKEVQQFRYEPARMGNIPIPSVGTQRLTFLINQGGLSNCEANPVILRRDRRVREESGDSIPRYERWTLVNAQGKIDESLLLTEKGWMSLNAALVAVMNRKADYPTKRRPGRCWIYDGVDPMMNG